MFEIHLFNRTEINNKATVNIQLKMKDIKFRRSNLRFIIHFSSYYQIPSILQFIILLERWRWDNRRNRTKFDWKNQIRDFFTSFPGLPVFHVCNTLWEYVSLELLSKKLRLPRIRKPSDPRGNPHRVNLPVVTADLATRRIIFILDRGCWCWGWRARGQL